MGRSIDVFNVIASDIGVKRFVDEKEESFCRRTAYSAVRFWLSAFCMDDGAFGKRGLTKQVMHRRIKSWIMALDRICPGIDEWFDADGEGIRAVYNRLIDIGDLAPNGFSDSYVATFPARVELSEDLSCITGYFDPTADRAEICGNDANSMLLSGLVSLFQSKNETILHPNSWWVRDREYIVWEKASDFGEVKFADIQTARWSINRSDVWTDAPLWVDGLTLARVDDNGVDPAVFIAAKVRGRVRLSRITWIQAQELFFYLRRESGNRAVAKYAMLDGLHMRAVLPIGFIPGHINRILDAIGWPVDNAADRVNRIIRVEALPLVEDLLSASYIGFERVSNGQ